MKKHGQEKRRVWRKLHLAVDADTHEVICADQSLNNVTDAEAFPGLIRQTHRKIRVASVDGAYDTKRCHDELRRKKIKALIPPRTRAGYWPTVYTDRNQAVVRQRLTGVTPTGNGIRLTTGGRWPKRRCTGSNSCSAGTLRCVTMMHRSVRRWP